MAGHSVFPLIRAGRFPGIWRLTLTDTLQAGDDAAAAVAVAPRVTLDSLHPKIANEEYAVFGGVLTICVLTTANGFTVTGESACASPENFNAELGRKFARERAVSKLWGLEGYLLREQLHLAETGIEPGEGMRRYIGTKAVNAKPMTRLDYNELRGWKLPDDEDGSDAGYLVEYADGQRPNVKGFKGYVSWSPADVFEGSYR